MVGDITQAEMLSVLSTLTGIPADQIGGWALLVRQACARKDCIGFGCEGGPMAILSADHTEDQVGPAEPYVLHMCAAATELIAGAMQERQR